jgi:hypothetical protein
MSSEQPQGQRRELAALSDEELSQRIRKLKAEVAIHLAEAERRLTDGDRRPSSTKD